MSDEITEAMDVVEDAAGAPVVDEAPRAETTEEASTEEAPAEESAPEPVPLAIFFDGDGTMWDFESLMVDGMYAARDVLAARTGVVTTVEAMIEDRDTVFEALAGSITNFRTIRRDGFIATTKRLGVYSKALANEMTDAFFAARDARPGLFEDTLPALTALRAQLPIGYLSNGNSRPAARGLSNVFAAVVMAEDEGVAKPDPALFRIAEAKLAAERYILVGDSLADDVAGAKAAGWTSVYVDRRGDYTPDDDEAVRPDYVVRSLADVVELVG